MVQDSRSNSIKMKTEAGVKGESMNVKALYIVILIFLGLRHSERVLVGTGHVGVFLSLYIISIVLKQKLK